jgi:hypothetical protein
MSELSRRRGRLARRLSWLVVAALATAALFPLPAFAAPPPPGVAPNAEDVQFVDGNPECDTEHSTKVDPPAEGTFGPVEITNLTDTSFDWALTASGLDDFDMAAVIVKAGSGAFVYFYEDTTDDSDTNLQSPSNDNDPQAPQADISHLVFCYNDKQEPEPTPTPVEPTPTPVEPTPTPVEPTPTPVEPTPTPVEPTPTPTGEVEPTATPTATPTGGVEGATGTPKTTLPPTDTLGSTQSPSGDGWRMILLAMAGLLGAALILHPSESRITTRRRR